MSGGRLGGGLAFACCKLIQPFAHCRCLSTDQPAGTTLPNREPPGAAARDRGGHIARTLLRRKAEAAERAAKRLRPAEPVLYRWAACFGLCSVCAVPLSF